METFFLAVVSSAMVAAALSVAILLLGRRLRRPALLHLLWIVVLVKLFVPPVFKFGLLPAVSAGLISIEGAVAGAADLPVQAASSGIGVWTIVGWSLIALWVAGSVTVLAVSVIRLRWFQRVLHRARPVDPDLAERIEVLATAVGCSRRPLAVTTGEAVSPMVWSGFGGPRLLLPQRLLTRLSDGQLDTILAHELAHLKRGDDRVRWIELVALVVFWWNPTTWVASRFLRDAEEACCDAIVARTLPAHVEEYAQGLVQAVRHLISPEPSPLVAASGLGRPALIERRIRAMFNKKTALPLSVPARLLIGLTAVIALGLSPMLTAREGSMEMPISSDSHFTGDPINLSLEDADIRDVLATFEQLTNLEIVIDPDVSEKITVEIEDVPWDQALHMILQMTGLKYSIENGRLHVGTGHPVEVFEKGPKQPTVVEDFEGRPLYRFVEEGKITEPKRVDGPNPRYPEQARKEGINGVVVMEAVIAADGSVREVEVVRSNAAVLSEAAVEAVEQWTFEPATLEGVPVAVRYILTVKFRLQ